MTISYRIIRSWRRRSVCIIIKSDKEVIVRAPKYANEQEIENFVFSNQNWIKKKLKLLKKIPKKIKKRFINGEKFLFLGKSYPLKIKVSKLVKKSSLKFARKHFEAIIRKNSQKTLRKLFLKWYFENAKKIIKKRVRFLAKKLKVDFNKIRLKKVKSLWGSCSIKKNLSFNWKIIMAPLPIIDYVILHELGHLVHRNHSQKFWQFLAGFDPYFKKHKTWLRKNYHHLSL